MMREAMMEAVEARLNELASLDMQEDGARWAFIQEYNAFRRDLEATVQALVRLGRIHNALIDGRTGCTSSTWN